MVIALGPGKFYGSSLPRPFFHAETRHNGDGFRVDPPVPVLDALLSWAAEAHWSMGGLSFKRRRLQGRIEGSVVRLRKQEETKERRIKKQRRLDLAAKARQRASRMQRLRKLEEEEVVVDFSEESEEGEEVGLVLESEGEGHDDGGDKEDEAVGVSLAAPSPRLKRRARNLTSEFDKAATRGWGTKVQSPVVSKTRTGVKEERSKPSSSPSVAVAVDSHTRRRKGSKVVVKPRRSSRISPAKKSGSV